MLNTEAAAMKLRIHSQSQEFVVQNSRNEISSWTGQSRPSVPLGGDYDLVGPFLVGTSSGHGTGCG